jgi:Ca2+-binding RTX toxin-like protein
MSVNLRHGRQSAGTFRKNFDSQLEHFGQDRITDSGDQIAAFRARHSFDVHPQKSLSGTGGQLVGSQPVRSLDDPIGPNDETNGRTPNPLLVPTTLMAAGIAIIGYNTDDPGGTPSDTISFVLLTAIGSGTQIFFTDRTWNGTTFAAAGGGEGTFTYTAGADLAAGTIVTITQAQLNGAGMNLLDAGETIYAYQGAINAPTVFLYAADIADNNTTFTGSLANTGLSVAAGTATAIAGDNGTFGDRGHNIQGADLLASISSPTNWTSNDDSPQNPITGNLLSAPDQYVFSVIAGDAGLLRMSRDGANVATQALHQFQTNPVPATQFNHPNDIVFDTVHGLFFIADSDTGNRRILQGNIADLFNPGTLPTLTVLYTDQTPGTGNGQINGLAIDIDHATGQGALYFVNQDDLLRVVYDHDGTSPTNQTPVNLASVPAGQFANELALDIATGRAWIISTASATEPITVPAGTPGAIFDPDSGTWYIVATNITNNEIYQVANLARTDTNNSGNTVTALDLNGATAGTDLVDEQGLLSSLDIDPVTGHIYFTAIQINNGIAGALGGIYRYSLGAGTVEILFSETNATDFAFKYIDVDSESGRYYVSNQSFESPGDINGTAINTSSIMFHATSAGAPTVFHANAGNINSAVPWGLIVDNAPTLSGTNLNPTQVETAGNPSANPTAVTVANAFTANDIDTDLQVDHLGGAQVRISAGFQAGAGHQDLLTIGGATSGTFAAGAAGAAQDITFSYNSATGVMILTGASTFAGYQAALAAIQFQATGDNPTNYGANGTRTISYSVTDGLMLSDEVHATVTVTGVNDAPVNANAGADSGAEDTTFNIAGLSVSDVDANPAAAGGQQLTVTLTVTRGTLTLNTGVAGGIVAGDIVGGAQGTATITIQASAAEINATFANATGVQFTGGTNVNGTIQLTMVTNDGGFNGNDAGLTGNGTSEADTDIYTITVTAVNDAPTVGDGTEAAPAILEDTPHTNLTAPTVATLFGVQFSDAADDQTAFPAGSSPNTFAGIAVITNGSSGATGQWQYWTGATWVNIGSPGAGSATFVRADALIRFEPVLNFNGNAPTLVAHLVDNSAGSPTTNGAGINLIVTPPGGTSPYSSGTVTLSQAITAVNDAPVNTVGGTLTVAEDSAATAVTGLSISDVDANPATDVFTVTLDVLHGSLNVLTGVPGGVGAGNVAGNGSATVTLTGTINQINATLAAAGGLTYTPTGDYNGSDRVQIVTDDGGATGLDPGATGTATSESDTDSKTINVTAVNDPVTGAAPPTLGVNEDATNVAVTGLSISDVDAALNPSGVYDVTLSSTNGTMTLTTLAGLTFTVGDGTADATMTFHGTLAAINTALATASYTPTGNYNGSATITLGVTDTFGGIVATGTGAATSDSDVIAVTVSAVNDPIGTSAPPTATIDEDAVNAAITGMSISDIDATLAPAGVYDVTLSATNGTLTLTTLAGLTFSAGDGTGDATMTFHGTLAAINTALATATYTPPANYNGPAQITLSATDTFGGIVATGSGAATNDSDVINVTVTAVNDTPVVSLAATGSSTEQVAGTVDATATISDLDLDARNGGNGDYAGAALTVANNGGNNANDLFAVGTSGAFTVNGSNLEAGGLVFATFSGGNGTPLVISFNSSGTAATTALVNAVIQSVQYTYTGDNPPVAGIDVAMSLDDGAPVNAGQGSTAGHPATGTDVIHLSITDTAENAPPVVDLNSGTPGVNDTNLFVEGTAGSGLGTAITVTDPDGDMIQGATITITDASAGDLLTANLPLPAGITIDPASTATTLILVGAASAASYETALGQLGYSNTGDDPTAGGTNPDRVITVTVNDAFGTGAPATMTMTVAGVNDEPTLAATAVNPTFNEGGAAVDLFSGVTADTIEAGQTFVSLTLTVTNVTDGANEILVVGGMNVALTNGNVVATPAGNVTVTLAGGTATVVVGPSTLSEAALQTLIDGLAYQNTSENPTDANRVVTITELVDSGSNTSPNDAVLAPNIASTVDVNAINDAPIATVPGLQTINEDASFTLSTGNGNAIQVADADATTLTVSLTVLHGTLTLASTAGLSFGAGDGTADTTMTFTGTAAAINAALGSGLTYNPNANFNGSDSIAVFTTDNGQTGTGPVGTDSDTVPINITAINDAPVVIGDGTESATTINEDTPGAGQTIQALFAGQYSDAADNQIPNGGASSPGQFSGIAVTANGSSAGTGQWQYFSGGVWTDIGAVSDGAAKLLGDPFVTLIRFNPAADYNGPAPTLTVHLIDNSLPFGIVNGQVVDLSGPGATGATTAYSTGTVVLSQDVTAVNDAPLNTVPGAQTINEDASFTLSTGNGNAIQVADADATTLTVSLTVLHGTLTLASTAGLSFGAGDGTADTTMTFTGTAAAINAALGSGLTYNPNANYNGPDSIAVLTTDGGQTGAGGPLQDNDSIGITVNSVNDAPSGANATLTGSEDDPLVLTAANFGFTDPIDGNAFLAVIIDTFPANGTLFLDSDGPGGAAPVDLSTIGAGVFVSVTDINAGHLYFQPDTDEFGNGYAQFTFRVQDDGGMLNGGVDRDPTANTIFIDITPDNLPPAVDLDGATGGVNYATTYVEDGAGVAIGSGVSVTDPNSGTGDLIESATITLTDRVAGDSLTLTGALPPGIVSVTTSNAGSITVTLTGPGTGAQYQALIQSILYASTSQDPTVGGTDLARTVTVTVNDGLVDSAVATTTIAVTAVDDQAVAQPDAFVITESGTIVAGNLFANNGSGVDSDPDGPPLAISAVNGSAGNVNTTILLASGASLTVNSNGTFDYNPNTAFLPTPTAGSGASNTPAHDSFTYTLAGGGTATVSITLTGLDTNDTLLGTAGVDILSGGAGNDTYYVENSGDQVIEGAGGGNDRIITSVSYTLGDTFVETLEAVAGVSAINLTGNYLVQTLIGNAGANQLHGGGGGDTLIGLGGNDIYYTDFATTQAVEAAGGGFDQLYSSVSYVLGAGSEIEFLSTNDASATAAINLTGNGFNQTLVGNDGANQLHGGGGVDVLVGLGGNDIYYTDVAATQAVEAIGGGNDQLYTSVSYVLASGSEIELLSTNDASAAAAINLTGNQFSQILVGNAGANVLDGKGGLDTLIGFDGADTFAFTSALGAGNIDIIADFSGNSNDGDDVIALDDAIFTTLGLGALSADAFVIGSAALDADDRIIYNTSNGGLYYDADGAGGEAAIRFATLSGVPALTASDFIVI